MRRTIWWNAPVACDQHRQRHTARACVASQLHLWVFNCPVVVDRSGTTDRFDFTLNWPLRRPPRVLESGALQYHGEAMRFSFAFLFLFSAVMAPLRAADAAGEEFFEKKIRPVLAAKCYSCHSAAVKEPMGGLRLDCARGLLNQRLLTAIGYRNVDLKMPPTGKLPDEAIADFRRWVEMGSPVPADRQPAAATPAAGQIDWAKAREYLGFPPHRQDRSAGGPRLGVAACGRSTNSSWPASKRSN